MNIARKYAKKCFNSDGLKKGRSISTRAARRASKKAERRYDKLRSE